MLLVGRQKNASGLWKEIMGYQAGEDALILPQRHCADAFFCCLHAPMWGSRCVVAQRKNPLRLLMCERLANWVTRTPLMFTSCTVTSMSLSSMSRWMLLSTQWFRRKKLHWGVEVCGLCWVHRSWFLWKDTALEFFWCIFFFATLSSRGRVPSSPIKFKGRQTSLWTVSPKLCNSNLNNLDGLSFWCEISL